MLLTGGYSKKINPVLQAVEGQISQYPESTLKDIYKSFFQDEFGPGHLLTEVSAARRYFDYELSQMTSKGYYTEEACGLGKSFCRLSMDMVVDGLMDADDFFNAFLESSKGFKLPDIAVWKIKWEKISADMLTLCDRIKNFDEDMTDIAEMLKRGEYVIHHSRRYLELYDPHYRIIKRGMLIQSR